MQLNYKDGLLLRFFESVADKEWLDFIAWAALTSLTGCCSPPDLFPTDLARAFRFLPPAGQLVMKQPCAPRGSTAASWAITASAANRPSRPIRLLLAGA